MIHLFSIELNLIGIEIGVIIFTGIGFVVMFGISSAKGGYQRLVESTLNNDSIRRKRN